MIRVEPFTTMHIAMQAGKFDHPNRLFASVPRMWSVVTSTINDYRELIPEFFSLPDFLRNPDGFDLGLPDPHVELPRWAKSAVDFVTRHRRALESDYVGEHLCHWIDLIFGAKQTGKAAIDADNVFHPHSYASALNGRSMADPDMLSEIQSHAGSFGITPRQLFLAPHPSRAPRRGSRSPSFSLLARVPADILALAARRHMLVCVTSDGTLRKFRSLVPEGECQIPACYGLSGHFAIFPSANIAVLTSGDSLHTFSMDAALTHLRSYRQRFSGLHALATGDQVLALLCHDGSLVVSSIRSGAPLYRANFHLGPAVDVAVSESLRLIATADAGGRIVLVQLWSGAFVRSFATEEPSRVLIVDDGFIAICEGRAVCIYTAGAQKVSEFKRDAAVSAWCPVERVGARPLIAVAFEDGEFVMIVIPEATVTANAHFRLPVTALAYDHSENALFIGDAAGRQILWTTVDCD
jgi:hypothetical protein